MTDPTPALSFDESALIAQIGQWSGLYLPLSDPRTPFAYTLEQMGLITLDRHQPGALYAELVNPPTPASMPSLVVLPKPDHAEALRDYYFGPRNGTPLRAAECEYCSAPPHMPHLKDCPNADPRDARIAALEAENEALKAKVARLTRELDLEEGFSEFMEGKAKGE